MASLMLQRKLTYAAVVYLRTAYTSRPPTISLVAAKTKVAPLKKQSIPRLELCRAQLLAKLLTSIRTALNVDLNHTFAWSDSTIVLHWLDGSPKRFKTFVGNRVSAILNQLPARTWKHVPTANNPADCASRGFLPQDLIKHSLWWEGPPWSYFSFLLSPCPLLCSARRSSRQFVMLLSRPLPTGSRTSTTPLPHSVGSLPGSLDFCHM